MTQAGADQLHAVRLEAQARRIEELEHRLQERSRVLSAAAQALAGEIRRREESQAALVDAQSFGALGQLAGGLAHDLRNLLATASLGYELIRRKSEDPVLVHSAASGHQALKQANGLIEGLLGLVRQRNEEQRQLVAAADWLPAMADLLRYAAGPCIDCRLAVAADVWPLRVVEHGLSSALINLLLNAREAMPEGGEITLSAFNLADGEARPASVPAGDFVVFAVRDNGAGMSREVLARAASPAFSTKPQGQGTGLGLYMVDSFVRAAHGYLHLSSTPGAGSEIRLYLPRSDTPGQAQAPAPYAGGATTLLLVDDDDLGRAMMATILREQGHRVIEASNGEVALALLPTLPRLALVATDLQLSGMDGPALVQALRQERPGLPALFLSALNLPSSPLADVPLLHKPFHDEQLSAAVGRVVAKPAPAADKLDGMMERLLTRIRSPDLLAALLQWRAARGAFLPTPTTAFAAPLADCHFLAQRSGDGEAFRFVSVGAALVAQLGRPLENQAVAISDDSLSASLAAAYARAARSGLPSYEYVRYGLGEAPPTCFERLILPVSADGSQLTHLLGYACFSNLATGASGEPIP